MAGFGPKNASVRRFDRRRPQRYSISAGDGNAESAESADSGPFTPGRMDAKSYLQLRTIEMLEKKDFKVMVVPQSQGLILNLQDAK